MESPRSRTSSKPVRIPEDFRKSVELASSRDSQGTELMGKEPVVVTDSYIDVPKTPGLMQMDQEYLKENIRPEETWWGDD